MTPNDFVKAFYAEAKKAEAETGISAIATLAQAALESGWGKAAPGNMFFGVKDTDGINGNEQLVRTTEYSRRTDLKFPIIYSITPVIRNGQKWFKYKVADYFRKYESPAACFKDHHAFFMRNKRYAKALLLKDDPERFAEAIAAAGYATDPSYATVLKSVIKTIRKHITAK